MLKETIPKNKYTVAVYPLLEDRATDGSMPIPLLWGHKHSIVPVCIDTTARTYKICDKTKAGRNALLSIDQIKADGVILALGTDYVNPPDLANGQFTLTGSPYLAATTLYYLVISGTWGLPPDPTTDYLHTVCSNTDEGYAGDFYTIDGGGFWTIDPAGSSLGFKIYGKQTIDGAEELMVYFDYATPRQVNIRDTAANTQIAQSFTTGANAFFLTRIEIPLVKNPGQNPIGTASMKILNAAKVQVGTASGSRDCGEIEWTWYGFPWAIVGTPSKIYVQATGHAISGVTPLDNVSDIIEDCYENVLGGSITGDLVAADFLALKNAKNLEVLGIYLDSEIEFGQFIEKLEVGQLFKFLPALVTKYTVTFAAANGGTYTHFRDEDFISFRMERDWNSIFQKIKIKYDEELSEYKIAETESDIAKYIYRNKDTLTLETFLKAADAATYATSYKGLLQYPQRYAIFEVGQWACTEMIPTQKIKLTRTRADYTGGTLSGILFRIMEITKNCEVGTYKIKAILDTQTY